MTGKDADRWTQRCEGIQMHREERLGDVTVAGGQHTQGPGTGWGVPPTPCPRGRQGRARRPVILGPPRATPCLLTFLVPPTPRPAASVSAGPPSPSPSARESGGVVGGRKGRRPAESARPLPGIIPPAQTSGWRHCVCLP